MNKTSERKQRKWWKKAPRRCYFSDNRIVWIDYKDADLLKKFINKQGKILSAARTGTKRKHQRKLGVAIKRARHIGLLPFVIDTVVTLNEDSRKRA